MDNWQKRRYKKRYVTFYKYKKCICKFENARNRTLEMGVSGDIILCRYYIQKK